MLEKQLFSRDKILVVEVEKGKIALRVRVEEISIDELKDAAASRLLDHKDLHIETEKNSGLSGGGALDASRSLYLDVLNLEEIVPEFRHSVPVERGRISLAVLNDFLSHDRLQNVNPARHVDHSKIEIAASDGLSGGGDLTDSRVVRLALQTLERVAPELDGMYIPVVDRDNLHGRVALRELLQLFALSLEETRNALAA